MLFDAHHELSREERKQFVQDAPLGGVVVANEMRAALHRQGGLAAPRRIESDKRNLTF